MSIFYYMSYYEACHVTGFTLCKWFHTVVHGTLNSAG